MLLEPAIRSSTGDERPKPQALGHTPVLKATKNHQQDHRTERGDQDRRQVEALGVLEAQQTADQEPANEGAHDPMRLVSSP
jgi:hypothetical protein